jgi:predicted YcjX-like family ATPase
MAYEFFGKFADKSELEAAIYKHLKRDSHNHIHSLAKRIVRDDMELIQSESVVTAFWNRSAYDATQRASDDGAI